MISCLNLGVCRKNEDKWSLGCFSLGQTWGSDKSQTSTNYSEAAFDGRALLLGSQPDGRGDGLPVIHSWSCWTFGLCRIFKHCRFVRLMNLTIHWCTGFRICHFSSIYLSLSNHPWQLLPFKSTSWAWQLRRGLDTTVVATCGNSVRSTPFTDLRHHHPAVDAAVPLLTETLNCQRATEGARTGASAGGGFAI